MQECDRLVVRRLTATMVRPCVETQEYVPVFVDDGTGIEVQVHQCEGTARGSNGEKRDWLHAVFVGAAWVSAWLNEGGTDVQGDWREQLEADVAPLVAADTKVWLRADYAYYVPLRPPGRGAEKRDDGAGPFREPREPLDGGPSEEAC